MVHTCLFLIYARPEVNCLQPLNCLYTKLTPVTCQATFVWQIWEQTRNKVQPHFSSLVANQSLPCSDISDASCCFQSCANVHFALHGSAWYTKLLMLFLHTVHIRHALFINPAYLPDHMAQSLLCSCICALKGLNSSWKLIMLSLCTYLCVHVCLPLAFDPFVCVFFSSSSSLKWFCTNVSSPMD